MGKKLVAVLSENIYRLPFDGKFINPSAAPKHHKSMINALDFPMSEGTQIYSALNGIIIEVKSDSNIGGSDESLRDSGNLIRIQHENGEYSEYVHLKYKGSLVKEGDKVSKGQLIGYSGTTGFTSYPHLHFGVYIFINNKAVYIKPRFKIKNIIKTISSPDIEE